MNVSDTIYALASGHGKAGVAVIRISGRDAFSVLPQLGVVIQPEPRVATLATLKHKGQTLDRALALTFPGPHSFTGENILELHIHGSRAVTHLVLNALNSMPSLRLAEPGEFARRAFHNNKFDLLEAEGLADLIDAETPAQHAQAMRQLGGELSARITDLREKILSPLALLEAYIDFPDEEIPEEVLAEVTDRVAALSREIRQLLDDGGIGEKIRDGIEIVIFGAPNAGKSSLLNAIAKRDIAIVSDVAGTTRDLIEVHLDLDGFPVTLVDTAGLRDAEGSIEAEGIRRAHHRIERAPLKIALIDSSNAEAEYKKLSAMIDDNTLVILNKSDIFPAPHSPMFDTHISATTGENFDQFIALLKDRVATLLADAPSPLITRARHRQAFSHALTALTKFGPTAPLELNCEELRIATLEIGKITGKITTDDLLDLVFSRFCIGK